LSKGIPAELGATWFEGLSMKNHYTLIARLGLWEKLQDYISALDEDEFKRALVFLRRAFADFSSNEKHDIAENMAEIWGLNKIAVSEAMNKDLKEVIVIGRENKVNRPIVKEKELEERKEGETRE